MSVLSPADEGAMMRIAVWMRRRLAASGVLVALAIGGCTTTYTEAQVEAQEDKEDAKVRAEGVRDDEIGAQGGVNTEGIDEQEQEVERESDL